MSAVRPGKGTALITGASAGLGEAFACALARQGYDLILVARREARLKALANQLAEACDVRTTVHAADLGSPDGLESTRERLRACENLTLLVNNAGLGASGRYWELDPERERLQCDLNTTALAQLSHAALVAMVPRRRGALILVSSLAGFTPAPYTATYSATKAFVNSFAYSLREELRGTGVRLQLLCPGFTRTEFQEAAGVETDRLPAFAWLSAEQVVETSLADLRRRQFLSIPGRRYRAASVAMRLLPDGVAARIGARITRSTVARGKS